MIDIDNYTTDGIFMPTCHFPELAKGNWSKGVISYSLHVPHELVSLTT